MITDSTHFLIELAAKKFIHDLRSERGLWFDVKSKVRVGADTQHTRNCILSKWRHIDGPEGTFHSVIVNPGF